MTPGQNAGPGATYPWLPDTSWPVLAPYWRNLRDGVLSFPQCTGCGRFQWYPQAMCPQCRAMDFAWTAVAPVGRVFTYTIVRRALLEQFSSLTPTTIALVDMVGAPGVRLVTNAFTADRGDASTQIVIDATVDIVIDAVDTDVSLPFALLR